MSFNFLPDELVAQMSSHLDDKDIANLLQTQKRINRTLKNFKMDKPDIYELNAEYTFEPPRFHFSFKNYELERPLNLSFVKENALVSALSMFRSVKRLRLNGCVLTDDLVDSIMKYKIKNGRLVKTELRLSADKFVLFSRKFSVISFDNCKSSKQYLNDDLLCQVVTSTAPEVWVTGKIPRPVFNLTDRFLDAMISGQRSARLMLNTCTTLFTVKGIRRFLEDGVIINQSFGICLGILNKDEQEDALDWYRYSKEHPELPYEVNERDTTCFSVLKKFDRFSMEPWKSGTVHYTLSFEIDRNDQ